MNSHVGFIFLMITIITFDKFETFQHRRNVFVNVLVTTPRHFFVTLGYKESLERPNNACLNEFIWYYSHFH